MTREEYDAIEAVNWSTLKEMRRSPKHYRHRVETPREDTTRLALGRAVHTAVLEPDRFLLDYALFSGARRAGKEWEKFAAVAEKDGRTILKQNEYQLCLAIRDAVREHPVAKTWLQTGRAEHSLVWTDKATGLKCKGRLDWWTVGAVIDLKTTADVQANRFGSTAARMGYHCQAAFYRAGMLAHGHAPEMKIIAVEMDPPHDVAVFALSEDVLYAGEEEVAELLRKVAECRASKEWPGRYPAETALTLPAWAYDDDNDETSGLDLEWSSADKETAA